MTYWTKKFSYRRAAHIILVGESPRQVIEAELGNLPNASVIHPGVNVGTEHGQEGRSGDVVFMGRWSDEKDPLAAVRAFRCASSDTEGTGLYLFGAGPLESELRRLSVEANRVYLMGWSTDPATDLSRGGVFLQTSRWENSPYAILDAMARGRTVVAYAVGDVGRMLDFGNAGLPVSPGDFDGLVRALKGAMSDRALRKRMSVAAPARVRSAYSRTEMVERTVTVYENALRSALMK
jgi:glycosyltransferase involved in cell wall biosynthesis